MDKKMNPVEIITAKRDGKELSKEEITYFVDGFTRGEIPDYQMSAFLMAVIFKSMTPRETAALTVAMLESGDKVEFNPKDKLYVDKHSSGGIGDKVSIILAPIVAACGLKVPMLSGRGLGHTGGTLDKLEAIPGYRTNLSMSEFKSGVDKVGCIISGQTPEIAPADRKMYALRDVTATVESIPLICGSILSKKFAAGPNSIVFDVKCGNGAFMKTTEQARQLGQSLADICRAMNKGAAFLVTDMNQPLGIAAGNALEIDECVAALNGKGPADLMDITYALGERMLALGGITSGDKAIDLQKKTITDGTALMKFFEMVEYQHGDIKLMADQKPLAPAKKIFEVLSDRSGFIQAIDTYKLGRLVIEMGGGRSKVGEVIDLSVGFKIYKRVGDSIKTGDKLYEIHSSGKLEDAYLKQQFLKCFTISNDPAKSLSLIIDQG
jgi:pyrimidine-nucleoside phosphorylase